MTNKYLSSITLIIMLLLKASYGIGQNYNEVAKVVASDRDQIDWYGYSVDISGDYAIVGAIKEDHDLSGANFATEAGAAYIVEKDGSGNWVEVQKLVASDRAAYDQFGYSVAISGDYAVVGAHKDFGERGSAYIFERDGSGDWIQVQKITASVMQGYDRFGTSVSVSGSYIIVGAHQSDKDANNENSLSNAGAAYVFARDGSGIWSETHKLVASDRGAEDLFGYSVAISGPYAIVGAYQEGEDEAGSNTMASAGAAYMFFRDGSGDWTEVSKHVASDREAGAQFGYSVSIYSTYAIIGANKESKDVDGLNPVTDAGAAYFLEKEGVGDWTEVKKVVGSYRAVSDEFGSSVSMTYGYAAVGAYKDHSEGGSVHVFQRNSADQWAELKYFSSSDRERLDQFGIAVAIDGTNLISGAPGQDYDSDGLNRINIAGASYVFKYVNNVRPNFVSSGIVSIPENTSSGSIVLDVNAYNGDGGTSDEGITYSLLTYNEDDLFFNIDSESGQLTINFSPDYENPSDENMDNVYDIAVRAYDGAYYTNQFMSFTVTDVDEIDPIITSPAAASVVENSAGVAYTATADEVVTFTLGSSKDEGLFTVANDNEISFLVAPDFEAPQDGDMDNAYLIDVIAEDEAGNSSSLEVTITVTDADETDPIITSPATASVAENSAGVAYTATADEVVAFTLGSSKDEELFAVANDNEISFLVAPDFEAPKDGDMDNAYLIDVIAEDAAGNTATLEVTITVTDEQETFTWNGTVWSNGTGPTALDDAIIDGDYSLDIDGAFEVNNLTINPTYTLTVDDENFLEIEGDLTNNGSLIVESGASLITYETNSFTGNPVTIKRRTRYADAKYSFVGTPVQQNASVTAATLGSDVYYYDESQPYSTNDGLNRWIPATGELVPGVGYTQANQQEIIFTGIPNVGDIVYSGTYTEDIDDENEAWNFVSNPYPAAIDVADFLGENADNSGAVYIWDDNGSDTQRGTNADYIVANASMATMTAAGGQTRYNLHIGSCQGFFIKLTEKSATDILFVEDLRVSGFNSDDNFFRKEELPIARINLTNSQGLFKQTVVGFAEDATENELNRRYDAQAFNSTSDDGIFTVKAGRSLSLNGMTPDWEVIQLQLNAKEAGEYQISAELEAYDQSLYLRDIQTGEVVDLKSGAYSFATQSGIHTDRFELISSTSALLSVEQNLVKVYSFDRKLYIQQQRSEEQVYQLFNMDGRLLISTRVALTKEVDLNQYPSGIYLVFDGQKTYKIILD